MVHTLGPWLNVAWVADGYAFPFTYKTLFLLLFKPKDSEWRIWNPYFLLQRTPLLQINSSNQVNSFRLAEYEGASRAYLPTRSLPAVPFRPKGYFMLCKGSLCLSSSVLPSTFPFLWPFSFVAILTWSLSSFLMISSPRHGRS